ncbi:hypothetical protein [Trichothermofontia sp.]
MDPTRATVLVLLLVDGLYESVEYVEDDRIQSSLLPELNLTVEQLLQAGNPS